MFFKFRSHSHNSIISEMDKRQIHPKFGNKVKKILAENVPKLGCRFSAVRKTYHVGKIEQDKHPLQGL